MGKQERQDDLGTPTFCGSNNSAERDVPPQYELEDPLGTLPSSGATGVTSVTSRFELYKIVVARR